MFEKLGFTLRAARAATAAAGVSLRWDRAQAAAAEAATGAELLRAARSMASLGESIVDLREADRLVQRAATGRSAARVAEFRAQADRLERQARAAGAPQRLRSGIEAARARLGDLEAAIERQRREMELTGELCEAALWASRFAAALAADAAWSPGSFSEATCAIAERVLGDVGRRAQGVARAMGSGRAAPLDGLLMELCAEQAPAAAKVLAWRARRDGSWGPEQARELAAQVRDCERERERIARARASESDPQAPRLARARARRGVELAQIHWLAGAAEPALDELCDAMAAGGRLAMGKALGLSRAGRAQAGSAVDGFNAWAGSRLDLPLPPA